jgi:outer membrane immunogenic protein
MKRLGLIGISLASAIFVFAPALAADLAPRYQQPVARPLVYYPPYWTGFYLGINGGGGWGESQWDGVGSFRVSGGLIGGTIGYGWQSNRVVIGAEGDIDWSGIRGSSTVFCPPGCSTRGYWLSTVRGRLGYSFERVLPYLTGGLALGNINATIPGFPGGSTSNPGWTIGGGVEVMIVNNVSLKAEYLFVDLANYNCGLNCSLLGNGNVSFSANLFRAGLNIHF